MVAPGGGLYLYQQGRFELDALVSSEITLADVQDGYASLKNPEIAVLSSPA